RTAFTVMHQIDHRQRPEMAAVLAYAPAFGLMAANAQNLSQDAFGHAVETILLGEEAAERVPENLIRDVALDPLCAWIPGHDLAAQVEHVDRVIDDRLDHRFLGTWLRMDSWVGFGHG